MLAISGMLVPLAAMPRPWPQIGAVLPMSHAVALLRGAWAGRSWLALGPHLGALALTIAICLAPHEPRVSLGVGASPPAARTTQPFAFHSRPNQRRARLEPNSIFSATSASDGA